MTCKCGHSFAVHFEALQAGAGCTTCPCTAYDLDQAKVPDVIGEIEGWRAWKVHGPDHRPRLFSVTYGRNMWPTDDWYYADCSGRDKCPTSDDGKVPGEQCSCGLYAARDREHLRSLGYHNYTPGMIRNRVVIGKVGFAGKVIVGSQGWRAEKGRILEFRVPYDLYDLAKGLEESYGAKVELEDTQSPAQKNWALKARQMRRLAERAQSRGQTKRAAVALRKAEEYEAKAKAAWRGLSA